MAYVTATQIQSDFKNINFSDSNARVTFAEVDEFITQEQALVDNIISKKYIVPVVSDATSVSLMAKITTLLVVHRIKKIIRIRHFDPKKQDQDLTDEEYKEAMDLLSKIMKGQITLNAPEMSDGNYHVDSFIEDDPSISPEFQKGVPQW